MLRNPLQLAEVLLGLGGLEEAKEVMGAVPDDYAYARNRYVILAKIAFGQQNEALGFQHLETHVSGSVARWRGIHHDRDFAEVRDNAAFPACPE